MSYSSAMRVTGCTMFRQNENYAWGPGMQKAHTIHYIIRGSGFLEVNGKRYRINSGESFLIYPNTRVKYYPDPHDPWQYLWVNFTGDDTDELLAMTAFPENPVCAASDKLLSIFNSFSMNHKYKYIQLRNTGLLYTMMSEYMELHPTSNVQNTTDYIYRAKKYISANSYRCDFGVTELADAVGVERSYLYRLFCKKCGKTPKEYITDVRMKNAADMLQNGTAQVKLIAYSVGFEDPLYFSKVFKKHFGVSPKCYIKNSASKI